jgi:hypothetical protein
VVSKTPKTDRFFFPIRVNSISDLRVTTNILAETIASGESVVAGYAEDADSVHTTDYLGKRRFVKRSWGSSAGKRSVNYNETEEHKIKSYKLRKLRDHECVLVHCERGFRRVTLPPLEADGTTAKWFSPWRKLFAP